MVKNGIQIKIGFLLVVAVVVLSAACYMSYRNLSSIVRSIRIEISPDLRLVTIRDISRDLELADNSIRFYTITRDTADLKPYYKVIDGIDEKILNLRKECSKDIFMLVQVDTISALIADNLAIWNELLYLINNDHVVEFLKRLSDQVNDVPAVKEKKGILKRVFARDRKKAVDEQTFATDIQKAEEQGRINKEKIKNSESQLALISGKIKEKFFDLISRMENQVSRSLKERGEAANRLAEETYTWLIVFLVSGGLLSIVVLFTIVRYVRNVNKYQLALRKSKEETEQLASAKELFLANISHELRTPVTAITGFANQLLHEAKDKNILRSLNIIKSSSDHLATLIDDILDLSKLQNGKLILENVHFSISQVMSEVSVIFENQAKLNHIHLEFSIDPETPPVLIGDPSRLKQILINLVGNAVKFTSDGTVVYSVKGIKDKEGVIDLLIEVADTGIGIEEEKLKLIFDDFSQAEMSTARKYGGTGLGLSIVKRLVDLHMGTIECESRPGKGTRMICHLLLRAGSEDQIIRDKTLDPGKQEKISNLDIIIVDDEEFNRLLFRKMLGRWKMHCDEAAGAMEAFEILKRKKYDIVLMDVRMPGIDGVQATEYIRNVLKISDSEMQVVCISAISVDGGWEKYRLAGMNAFVQKPFTEEMLLSTILSVAKNLRREINVDPGLKGIMYPPDAMRIDLNKLKYISGGDNQFVKQMLLSFNSTTRTGLIEMRKAAADEKWEQVSELAHRMSPPCRHIGATDLYELLKKIEDGIKGDFNKTFIENLTDETISEFEYVSEKLEEYISKLI